MNTTPTPGDLSALSDWLLDKAAREPSAAEQHMLREAAAALSALPAAGEPVAWCALNAAGGIAYFDGKPMVMPGKVGNEHHPTPLYTTPQPSAAEGAVPFSAKWLDDNGQEATMEWRAGWDACRVEYPRTAPPAKAIPSEDFLPMPACLRRDVDDYGTPDAAVGAQGDGDD